MANHRIQLREIDAAMTNPGLIVVDEPVSARPETPEERRARAWSSDGKPDRRGTRPSDPDYGWLRIFYPNGDGGFDNIRVMVTGIMPIENDDGNHERGRIVQTGNQTAEWQKPFNNVTPMVLPTGNHRGKTAIVFRQVAE